VEQSTIEISTLLAISSERVAAWSPPDGRRLKTPVERR